MKKFKIIKTIGAEKTIDIKGKEIERHFSIYKVTEKDESGLFTSIDLIKSMNFIREKMKLMPYEIEV